ncbi:hypothetical protein [Capnocytophaga cynodegmi]|uniref:hypothetical protein n=1 Tax=Capnocytophaga cynodegmi TaxID=28189 RepID=UPI001BB3AC31|nr:hypothetical protein [Capnocytophaga cynodegmi]
MNTLTIQIPNGMTIEKAKSELSRLNYKVIDKEVNEIPEEIVSEVQRRFEEFKKHPEKVTSFLEFKNQILKERYGV